KLKLSAHKAEENFLICVLNAAEISSETVLIQLLACLAVPETAGVRGDLVCQDYLAVVCLSELKLEVDKSYAEICHVCRENLVYLESHGGYLVEFFLCAEVDGCDVIFVYHGIAQSVVLVAVLKNCACHLC